VKGGGWGGEGRGQRRKGKEREEYVGVEEEEIRG